MSKKPENSNEYNVIEYVVHINSGDCEKLNGSNTNHILCKIPTLGDTGNNITIQLLTATIPFSFYNINNLFRFLSLRESETADPSDFVNIDISVPEGNYSITQLQSELQSQLNGNTVKGVNYILSYNRISNKLTFSTDTSGKTITLLFDTGNLAHVDLQNVLGFNREDYSFSIASSLTSVKPCNVSPYSNIYIVAPNLSITSQINSKFGNYSTILNKVPINNVPNSFIYYENDLFVKYRSGLTSISTIELKLTDEDGDLIDINGVNWFTSIKIILTPTSRSNIMDFLNNPLLPVQLID